MTDPMQRRCDMRAYHNKGEENAVDRSQNETGIVFGDRASTSGASGNAAGLSDCPREVRSQTGGARVLKWRLERHPFQVLPRP